MKPRSSLRRPLLRALLGATGVALTLVALPRVARATEFQVTGRTAVQGYEVASPWGDVVLERRRFLQTLGVNVTNLQGAPAPNDASYSMYVMLRLDADFGANAHLSGDQAGGETRFEAGSGSRYVPGYADAPLDLMYAYLEGKNLAGGWLGFRLGRQYITDVLGWWSFDGGLVRVTTPFFVQAEFYGGFEQRGGFPLSTSRFERQGIWRGSHRDFGGPGEPPGTAYPSYQFAEMAPAFGVALETNGPSFVHGRFDYRRVYNTGGSITQQFPGPQGGTATIDGLRLSQDRLGYAADLSLAGYGAAKGGFAYDLYNQLMGNFYGGLEAYLGRSVTLGADLDYYEPTFDGDSIWNWFSKNPMTTFTGRADVRFTPRFNVAASGGARLWTTDGDPETFGGEECVAAGFEPDCLGQAAFDPSTGAARDYVRDETHREGAKTTDALANLAGRYRFDTGNVGLRGMLQTGERGRRVGADLDGEKRFSGGKYALGARVSLYDWEDPLRPTRDATSFGYVLGAGYKAFDFADMNVEWEHDMNRLVGQRFRVVAMLNLKVGP